MGIKDQGYCKNCYKNNIEISTVLLPCCLQAICSVCIDRLSDCTTHLDIRGIEGKSVICPYCETSFEASTISFDENKSLSRLVSFSSYKTCLRCENNNPVTHICDKCYFFCEMCFAQHEKLNHSSQDIHRVREIVSTDARLLLKYNQRCDNYTCKQFRKSFYCSDCEQCCCSKCIQSDHSEHNYNPFENTFISKSILLMQKIKNVVSKYGLTTAGSLNLGDEDDVQKSTETQTRKNGDELGQWNVKSNKIRNIIRFIKIALETGNISNFLLIAPRLDTLLESILSGNAAQIKDEITWRSYPIDSFPAVSYLHGIMLDFCERLTNAAKTMSLDIHAHPRNNKVNIGFVGRPERKLMRLVSKKTGQTCDEIEDEDVYNTSLHIPLPFILVCFLKENETISCCVEGKCSIEQQFESLLKSPVRTLIVHQNADLSFSNRQTHLVVSNQKDEVRQGLASLVEEAMFGKFEEYEKDIDRDSYSLLQEFSAIRRLQEPMDLAISTDISTKRKVSPEIIQLLSKYDDIVAFGVWNTDFRILTKKSFSAYQKNNICKQLEETDKSFYTSCKPSFYIIINEEKYCPYAIQQGAKITEHGNSVIKRTSGTLGGIAIGSNQKLYGLTCSHVLPQIDSAVYMSDGLGNSIGQCIFSNASGPESMCDFAVFEVDGHIVYNCIRSLVDEKNKERKASLCKFDLSSLSGKYVHKKGASTEWTKGIIACAELHDRFSCGRTDSKELMVFEGLNKTQFADRGDSGSLVIAHDLRNNRNNLLVLGMVSGGELELREDNSSANTQNLTSYSLGFSLNHAIDLFKKKFSNIDLHFDNDIKSSSSESDSE